MENKLDFKTVADAALNAVDNLLAEWMKRRVPARPRHKPGMPHGPGGIKNRSKFKGVEMPFCAISTRTSCYG